MINNTRCYARYFSVQLASMNYKTHELAEDNFISVHE